MGVLLPSSPTTAVATPSIWRPWVAWCYMLRLPRVNTMSPLVDVGGRAQSYKGLSLRRLPKLRRLEALNIYRVVCKQKQNTTDDPISRGRFIYSRGRRRLHGRYAALLRDRHGHPGAGVISSCCLSQTGGSALWQIPSLPSWGLWWNISQRVPCG